MNDKDNDLLGIHGFFNSLTVKNPRAFHYTSYCGGKETVYTTYDEDDADEIHFNYALFHNNIRIKYLFQHQIDCDAIS